MHHLPVLYPIEEPSKDTDPSKESLLSESNAGELLQAAGHCSTEEKVVSSPERDSSSLSLEEKLGSTQGLGVDSAPLEQPSTDVQMKRPHPEVDEEPSDLVATGTTSMTIPSTPPLFHSQDDTTSGESQLRAASSTYIWMTMVHILTC